MNFKQVIFTVSIKFCVFLITMASVMVGIHAQLQTEFHQLQHKTTLFENELNRTVDNNNIKMAELKIEITSLNDELNRTVDNNNIKMAELKIELTSLNDELNRTVDNIIKMAELKIELTSLNETLVDTQQMLKKCDASGPSCKNLKDSGFNANGVYTITGGGTPFRAFCDMADGFMVFQRRFDGSTDFHQLFEAYATGFGNLNAEFWLGLEKMHQFTKNGRHQLRVDLLAYDGETAYALYDDFSIGAAPGYQLHIGNYSGTATDALTYHNNQDFSTIDHDADMEPNVNCAAHFQGAFWYKYCHRANINAFNYHGKGYKGMIWFYFKGDKPMKATSMMVL